MIREIIKREARKKRLSVYKLAKLSGLQITQLNGFLKGLKTLNSNNIEKLFEVLELEVKII